MVNPMQNIKARIQVAKVRLSKIPALRLIALTIEGAGNHDAAQRAAGVAYYAILSTFPLILGLIAVFGFFLPSVNLQDGLLTFVGENLPGATNFLKENFVNIVRLRGPMGLISISILFWGASGMFSAISLAISRAWDIRRSRSFFIRKASELGMALGTWVLFLLSMGASAVTSIIKGVSNLSATNLTIINIGTRLLAFLAILAVFLLIYKLIPYTKTYWRYVWPGALLSAILFEIARTLFVFYIQHFGNYELIYGSLTSIIVLLVWIYYSSFILILGAEFTSQYSCIKNPMITMK